MSAIHICRGTNRFYIARTRSVGQRRWSWVGPHRKSLKRAMQDLINHWSSHLFEGEVALCADWYEPTRCFVVKNR